VTIRRLSYTVLTFSTLALLSLSGCGGSSGPLQETVTADTPAAPPAGFQEQQKAIGGNMMKPNSIVAPPK
jgi:hypothetical protein